MLIWNKEIKLCTIVEFSCPLDTNISRKVTEKLENYGPLVQNSQITYPDYNFEIAPIVVGALGHIPKCLSHYLKMVGFQDNELKHVIKKLQI